MDHPVSRRPALRAAGLAALLACASCVGAIGTGDDPAPAPAGSVTPAVGPGAAPAVPPGAHIPAGTGAPLPTVACTPDVGPSRLRRLTVEQYRNAVVDLLGASAIPATAGWVPDDTVGGFRSNAVAPVAELAVEQLQSAAETLAAAAATRLPELLPCTPATKGERPCAAEFIRAFLRQAYRRPPAADEVAAYEKLYDEQRARSDFAGGVRLVIQAALQAPAFLYHLELDDPAPRTGKVPLDAHALAARLSFYLWNAPPDAALRAAADRGALADPAELDRQARRLLASPRARTAVWTFHAQWLGLDALDTLDKDTKEYPRFSPELRADWREETRLFTDDVVFGGGAIGALLTAPFSYLNSRLGGIYGVAATGTALRKTTFDDGRRAGLLTHGSLLATHPNPVGRGKLVRERLLCQEVPPPPPDVDTTLAPAMPGTSRRQQLERHASSPACAACHALMDPIGLGFEAFDGIGAFRTTYTDGLPVDTAGEMRGSRDADGRFAGPVELAARLARSGEVRDCLVAQWFTFALGREPAAADACTLRALSAAAAQANGNVLEMVTALVQADAFRTRRNP